MKFDRVRNSKRNMLFGVVYRIFLTLLPFINRTVLIYVLGIEYLGLNSLFSSVLNILNLAELGFGSAIVYSMYKPIAENDAEQVCALLNFYRKVYRIIGTGILCVGSIAIFFVDKLVAGEIPSDINIQIVFLIQLLNVVFSYFFMAYKSSLLSAFQREDLISKISTIVIIIQYMAQFALVFAFRNYHLYLAILPICTVINNIFKAYIVKQNYPQYECKGDVNRNITKSITIKVKALLLHKIGGVVANSLDNIVISSYMGLVAVAIYNNYWYIYSSICYFIAIFHTSIQAGLGNSIALETKESNYGRFIKINFINFWIVGWCSCCLMCLYQPFMKLWVGEKLMYPIYMVILFVIYFYINMARRTVVTFKEAAGLWVEDRFKPIVSASVNIILNVALIKQIGICGVVVSTIISFVFVEIPWETYVLFRKYFNISAKQYYMKQLTYGVVIVAVIAFSYFLCQIYTGDVWAELIIRGCICAIVPNILIGLVYRKELTMVLPYINRR